jgi:hypothetical protein
MDFSKRRYHILKFYMLRSLLILFMLVFFTLPVHAGDFHLTICNDSTYHQFARNSSWPVLTTGAINSDIQLFSSGGDPRDIFEAAFTNNHFGFCSVNEIAPVRASFVRALITAKRQRVKSLTYYLQLLGTKKAVAALGAALTDKNLSSAARKRLLEVKRKIASDKSHYRDREVHVKEGKKAQHVPPINN